MKHISIPVLRVEESNLVLVVDSSGNNIQYMIRTDNYKKTINDKKHRINED